MLSVEQRQQRELEERDRELQSKVAQATCDHLVTQLEQDLLTLRARLPTKEKEAAESLLDAKYLRDRQKLLGVFTHFHTSKFCFVNCHADSCTYLQDCYFNIFAMQVVLGINILSHFKFLDSKDRPRMVPKFHGAEVQASGS